MASPVRWSRLLFRLTWFGQPVFCNMSITARCKGETTVRFSRMGLALCAAALVLGAGATASSANRLSLNNSRFKMVWSEFRFQEGAVELVCPMTLEGTLSHTTFTKVAGLQVGSVTVARFGTCRGGSATFLNTLPWSLNYRLFEGTLPNIANILLYLPSVAVRLRDSIFGVQTECLYAGNGNELGLQIFALRESSGGIGTVTPPEIGTSFIEVSASAEITCPRRITTGGSGTFGTMTVPPTTNPLTLTLI